MNNNTNNNNRKYTNFLPYLLVFPALILLWLNMSGGQAKDWTYTEFKENAETYTFTESKMKVYDNAITVSGKYANGSEEGLYEVTVPNTVDNVKEVEETVGKGNLEVVDGTETSMWSSILISVLPFIIMIPLGLWFIRQMGAMGGGGNSQAMNFTKSRARVESDSKVRFKDVAGCEEEKQEVAEVIDYLKSPKKYTDMGAQIPKGILMIGPPGTGKTLLAKAVAGEANVPFFSISGSDFVEMFVGTGASRVRDMFKKAQQAAPCILFIDEIDAVGRQRGAGLGGGNDEREQTLNQLLVEMDGMGKNNGVVVMAATNRADVLDPALLRSGRFDRQIRVNLPDKKGREAILEVHARGKKLASDVSLAAIAQRTPGFSGADLANLLNEAAILTVREKRTEISMEDMDESIDRVMMGPAKKSRKYTEKEKRMVAYHEAGHAVIGLKLDSADDVHKITIIPRGDAGGYNMMMPEEERNFPTKSDFKGMITGLMGGRVAEEVVFNEISVGASSDIQRSTKIAKSMVRSWGMSKLGPIQYDDGSDNVFLGRDYGSSSAYSGEIAFEIDKEIRAIINECHDDATRIIVENRNLLNLIAETLIEHETITKEQITNLVTYGTITDPNASTTTTTTGASSNETKEEPTVEVSEETKNSNEM